MKSSVLSQLAELDDLSPASLKTRWRQLFGGNAPAYGRQLLIRRLAYRIQEVAHGGLSTEIRLQLQRTLHQDCITQGDSPALSAVIQHQNHSQMPPGTRLVREWRGRLYEVLVFDGGFEFEGSRYRSLSAIAKAITGTHWNGPCFFGLREGKKKDVR